MYMHTLYCAGTFPKVYLHLLHVAATKYKMSNNNVPMYLVTRFLLGYNNNRDYYARKVYRYTPPIGWRTVIKKK